MDGFMRANAAFSKFSRNYMQLKKNLPIRPSEMGVLNILLETPGPHTSILLAQMLGVSKPMITAHLSVLERKGYITRQQAQDDKRFFYVLPTEKARALAEQAKADMNRQLEQVVGRLGQNDFVTLVKLMTEANLALEGYRDGHE